MQDADEIPVDRYDTPWDGDEQTQRIDGALDCIDARLIEMDARLTRIEARLIEMDVRLTRLEARLDRLEARLDRMTRLVVWVLILQTLGIAVGVGLVAWPR
jgi:hypothetical protein